MADRIVAKKNHNALRREKARISGTCLRCNKCPMELGYTRCNKCRMYERVYSKGQKKRERESLRLAAFNAYGGAKCICTGCTWHNTICGIIDLNVLTFDHINNEGAKHRKELGLDPVKYYKWLKNSGYPPILQILCYNCNISKYKILISTIPALPIVGETK